MDKIARLIEQLHSPKKDERYEACEWLRTAPALPAEALAALEQATHDPEDEVADAAGRAIAVQTQPDVALPPEATMLRNSTVFGVTLLAFFSAAYVSGFYTRPGVELEICYCPVTMLLALGGAGLVTFIPAKSIVKLIGAFAVGVLTGLAPWLEMLWLRYAP